jgi:hypothetical protein
MHTGIKELIERFRTDPASLERIIEVVLEGFGKPAINSIDPYNADDLLSMVGELTDRHKPNLDLYDVGETRMYVTGSYQHNYLNRAIYDKARITGKKFSRVCIHERVYITREY